MQINPGDICLINIDTKTGVKKVKALLVEQNHQECLWLLIFDYDPTIQSSFPVKQLQTFISCKPRTLAYGELRQGNLILTGQDAFEKIIGTISCRQLCDICCDIFSSHESWKLIRIRNEQTTGIKFWLNQNPYTCVCIPGMRRSSQGSNE